MSLTKSSIASLPTSGIALQAVLIESELSQGFRRASSSLSCTVLRLRPLLKLARKVTGCTLHAPSKGGGISPWPAFANHAAPPGRHPSPLRPVDGKAVPNSLRNAVDDRTWNSEAPPCVRNKSSLPRVVDVR